MRPLTAVLAVFLLASLAHQMWAADKPEVIRIGFASVGLGGKPVTASSSLATVHIKGLLEDEFRADGIRIEWTFNKGAGPAINEALAAGAIDFAHQGDFPSVLGRANGLKTRIIAASGVRGNTYLAVPVDSTATSLRDLLGKRVAYHRGTNATLGIAKILRSQGYSDADFRTINLDGSSASVAIANHEVDAVWGSSLSLFDLQQRKLVRIIDSTRSREPSVTLQAHLLVTESFEQRYPVIVQRVVDVLVKEAAWEADERHRDELFALWSRSGYSADVFAYEYREVPLRQRATPLLDEFFYARYREAAATSLDLKLIRRPIEVDSWIEPKYVLSAVKRFGLAGTWPEFDADGAPRDPGKAISLPH